MLPVHPESTFEWTEGSSAFHRPTMAIGSGSATPPKRGSRWTLFAALFLAMNLVMNLAISPLAAAQDWGEPEDDWGVAREPAPSQGGSSAWDEPADTSWAFRVGAGFTVDPNTFLLNFELPYTFDRYVSVGPMLQVGIEDEKLIIAPTINLTIRVPDMPGDSLDRFHPHLFGGMGLAILNNDDRSGENTDVGFLINTGVGIDFDLSERVTIGSRMIFNFLPADRTLGQKFWYAWEVGSIRLAF